MNESTPAPTPLLLNSKNAAKALSISERTLFSLRKAGQVRCVKIGRAVRYDLRDVQAFFDRQRGGGR